MTQNSHKGNHDSHKGHSYKATIKALPETSEIEITSSIDAKEFAEAIAATLEDLRKEVSLPGFRKGAAPAKMVKDKIGESTLLAEAAEHAIGHAYGHILQDEKIDAIGHPQVTIKKIAEGNPLEFTIRTAILPVIEKLDYKKIAASENKKAKASTSEIAKVTDEDLAKAKEKDPEITKEDLEKQNEYRAKEKNRLSLIEAITKDISIVIPNVLIEGEVGQMLGQMRGDIERMGLSFADYLKHLKKTEEDLKKEWRPDAEKRVKLDLLVAHIANKEKIIPDADKVETEIKAVQGHYKDIDVHRARDYFRHLFTSQSVFEFLEKQD